MKTKSRDKRKKLHTMPSFIAAFCCLLLSLSGIAQTKQRQNATYTPVETIITDLNADTVNDTIILYHPPVEGDPGIFTKMNVSVNGRRVTFHAKYAWEEMYDFFLNDSKNAVDSKLAFVHKEHEQSFIILFGRATPGGREELLIVGIKDRNMEIVFHNSIGESHFFADLDNDGHIDIVAQALPEYRNEGGETVSGYMPYIVYSLTPYFDINKTLTEKYNKEHYIWEGMKYNADIKVLYPKDGSKPRLLKP